MKITSKQLKSIRNDLAKKLNLDIQFEENDIKKNGAYIDILYNRPTDKSRKNCFYAKCDLSFKFVGVGGNFDSVTAQIMTLESGITSLSFMSEDVMNIEKFEKINEKLRYGILYNDSEAERDLNGNKIEYNRIYDLTIFIGA